MSNSSAKASRAGHPVISIFALTVPVICGIGLLALRYQITAILFGALSFFAAISCLVLCLVSLLVREKPYWIVGLAFMANTLLIYSLTFIDLH